VSCGELTEAVTEVVADWNVHEAHLP
jgi:hypothetical protein